MVDMCFLQSEAFTVTGLCRRYDETNAGEIPNQWDELASCQAKIGSRVDESTYGVVQSLSGDHGEFEYWSGVSVSRPSNDEAFSSIELSAQTYAVFPTNRPLSDIQPFCNDLFSSVLPELNLVPAKAPFIEHYSPDFDPVTGAGKWEIWIPLAFK